MPFYLISNRQPYSYLNLSQLKLAAIDIGSNAARLQISKVLEYDNTVSFKKVEYVRFPLRLGHDVFTTKKIGPESEDRFLKLLHCYKLLMELHEVKDYMICATSAMREAKNSAEIVARAQETLGMKIQVIDGNKEAELINKVVVQALDEKNYLHIDVGGGSTELNIYVNKQKIASHSFRIGSVRNLEHTDSPLSWKKMREWIEEHIKSCKQPIIAVGTGGNINKVYDLVVNKEPNLITITDIEHVQQYVESFSLEDRINKLRLNPDRADVIVPASQIYLSVMQWAGCEDILVPDVGLKDGVIELLYEKHNKANRKDKTIKQQKDTKW